MDDGGALSPPRLSFECRGVSSVPVAPTGALVAHGMSVSPQSPRHPPRAPSSRSMSPKPVLPPACARFGPPSDCSSSAPTGADKAVAPKPPANIGRIDRTSSPGHSSPSGRRACGASPGPSPRTSRSSRTREWTIPREWRPPSPPKTSPPTPSPDSPPSPPSQRPPSPTSHKPSPPSPNSPRSPPSPRGDALARGGASSSAVVAAVMGRGCDSPLPFAARPLADPAPCPPQPPVPDSVMLALVALLGARDSAAGAPSPGSGRTNSSATLVASKAAAALGRHMAACPLRCAHLLPALRLAFSRASSSRVFIAPSFLAPLIPPLVALLGAGERSSTQVEAAGVLSSLSADDTLCAAILCVPGALQRLDHMSTDGREKAVRIAGLHALVAVTRLLTPNSRKCMVPPSPGTVAKGGGMMPEAVRLARLERACIDPSGNRQRAKRGGTGSPLGIGAPRAPTAAAVDASYEHDHPTVEIESRGDEEEHKVLAPRFGAAADAGKWTSTLPTPRYSRTHPRW